MAGARTELFGRSQPGGLFALVREDITTGKVFFVNSVTGTDGAGAGRNPLKPLATIDYAIGLCTANQNDRIYVMPGHAETIVAAGTITCDVAGVSIIGLGNGSNRPTVSFGTLTTATWAISAANVTIRNIRVKPTVDELVKMFVVTGAYCTLDNIEHVDNASTAQTLQFVNASAAADYLTIQNCFCLSTVAGTATQIWIQLVGCDGARILDNVFQLVLKNETGSYTIGGTTAVVYCQIGRNVIFQGGGNTQDGIIKLVTGSTGMVHNNVAGSGTGVATATAFTGDACYFMDNKWADTIGTASGLLTPTVDSDT